MAGIFLAADGGDGMSAQVIKHSKELGFTIVAIPDDYVVRFFVYEVNGWYDGGSGDYDAPMYQKKGAANCSDWVDTIEESEPYLHGEVKWDGCSNWHFDEQERCMLHGCTREDLENIGKVMAMCWDMTAEICPNWST